MGQFDLRTGLSQQCNAPFQIGFSFVQAVSSFVGFKCLEFIGYSLHINARPTKEGDRRPIGTMIDPIAFAGGTFIES